MFLVKDKVVSLSIVEEYFSCDLDRCLGQCCVEGDSGAPLEEKEVEELESAVECVKDMLSPGALRTISEEGVSSRDRDGDLVTTIVDGRDCVFTTYAPGGKCLCALEKAWREGKIAKMVKPLSCSLYPIRVAQTGPYIALNYHRWKICKSAEVNGRARGIRIYEALEGPLVRAFGREWYDELCEVAREYLSTQKKLRADNPKFVK